jgi:glutamate 5-kinase
LGTQFLRHYHMPIVPEKRWIAQYGLIIVGKVLSRCWCSWSDRPLAVTSITCWITHIEGAFEATDAVQIVRSLGQRSPRNYHYSSVELRSIQGHRSTDIIDLLGYLGEETVIHRDNLYWVKISYRLQKPSNPFTNLPSIGQYLTLFILPL